MGTAQGKIKCVVDIDLCILSTVRRSVICIKWKYLVWAEIGSREWSGVTSLNEAGIVASGGMAAGM